MSLPPVIKEGSVKSIRGILGEAPYIFEYSDRYSVFDWGGMPDELDEKGISLAYMANFFFDYLGDKNNWERWTLPESLKSLEDSKTLTKLRTKGLNHHGINLVDDSGKEITEKTNKFAVKPVKIVEPNFVDGSYNYEVYKNREEHTLVPLEVIFRFAITNGSSLLKRVGDQNYLSSLGLTNAPAAGDTFTKPIVEYSTKLESTDRYITLEEGASIAGLNSDEQTELNETVILLSARLKDLFNDIDIELLDGKFEFGFTAKNSEGNREFMLVDSIGPDELRLTYKGKQLSKENLRTFYRDTPWHHAVEKAKELATNRKREDWKNICIQELGQTPPDLDPAIKEATGMLYKTIANELARKFKGEELFADAWNLDTLIERL